MPKGLDFDNQYEWASLREMGVASFLRDRGWFTLPTYDYSGKQDDKAPILHGPTSKLIIPDVLAFKAKSARWFEVKAKTEATFHRKTQVWETGFSLRHWEHYRQVQTETGIDVLVFFVHDNKKPGDGNGEVRFASLNDLDRMRREYNGDKMGRGGMVFFPYDRLTLIVSTSKLLSSQAA